jgi:hypothetical protein
MDLVTSLIVIYLLNIIITITHIEDHPKPLKAGKKGSEKDSDKKGINKIEKKSAREVMMAESDVSQEDIIDVPHIDSGSKNRGMNMYYLYVYVFMYVHICICMYVYIYIC